VDDEKWYRKWGYSVDDVFEKYVAPKLSLEVKPLNATHMINGVPSVIVWTDSLDYIAALHKDMRYGGDVVVYLWHRDDNTSDVYVSSVSDIVWGDDGFPMINSFTKLEKK
jgi:hypothetical protein